ncbi:serine kinase [bacterium]|nr:serine kinase [bacterium]
MKLEEIVHELKMDVRSAGRNLAREVRGGYASDLLSDVMANAEKDYLWVTLQIHQNIVAVAVLKELAGVIIVNGREPEPETLAKAEKEGVPILVTQLPTFEIVGRLHQLGFRGTA